MLGYVLPLEGMFTVPPSHKGFGVRGQWPCDCGKRASRDEPPSRFFAVLTDGIVFVATQVPTGQSVVLVCILHPRPNPVFFSFFSFGRCVTITPRYLSTALFSNILEEAKDQKAEE